MDNTKLHEHLTLIDVGANLTHESFDHDLADVVSRAQAHGVAHMVITGADSKGNEDAYHLAKTQPTIFSATAGVHPHHAIHYDETTDQRIRTLTSQPEVKAVGEMGLDYFRNYSPRQVQIKAFEKQLAIAIDRQLPVFLHQRDAHEDFIAILKNVRDQLPAALVHCFTDQQEALFDYLDIDCHIGITGWICDERRGTHLPSLVSSIPTNRLMLETDAPYLLPRDIRPKPSHRRNEPMYLEHICKAVAHYRHEDPATTAANTTATAKAFFAI